MQRCSDMWLHSLVVWSTTDHSWFQLSILVDYSQLVMGRSGPQTDLSKGNIKEPQLLSVKGKIKEQQIWGFHYILTDIWGNNPELLIQHFCLNDITSILLSGISLLLCLFSFSWFSFFYQDKVGWDQLFVVTDISWTWT